MKLKTKLTTIDEVGCSAGFFSAPPNHSHPSHYQVKKIGEISAKSPRTAMKTLGKFYREDHHPTPKDCIASDPRMDATEQLQQLI